MPSVLPRVFISSVITGFEAYREAAANGVSDAGCEPVMVEQFPALDASPRTACLNAIDSCDGVLVIVGERAGFKTPSGKYVVEEEWQYARKRSTPLHVFVQDAALELDAERIAKELSEFVHGRFRLIFKTPEELRMQVSRSLQGLIAKMISPIDTQTLTNALLKTTHSGYETRVRLGIQPLRNAELIDPLELDSRTFQDELLRLATSGSTPLLSLRAKKTSKVSASSIHLAQPGDSGRDADDWSATAELSTHGYLLAEREVGSPARKGSADVYSLGLGLQVSDLREAVSSLFQFAAAAYNRVDPYIAYRDFVYNVSLVNLGLRYIYDEAPSGSRGMPIRMANDGNILAFDSAKPIVREALDQPGDEVSRVVALLRRQAQPDR